MVFRRVAEQPNGHSVSSAAAAYWLCAKKAIVRPTARLPPTVIVLAMPQNRQAPTEHTLSGVSTRAVKLASQQARLAHRAIQTSQVTQQPTNRPLSIQPGYRLQYKLEQRMYASHNKK